jgi:hypothetical protein
MAADEGLRRAQWKAEEALQEANRLLHNMRERVRKQCHRSLETRIQSKTFFYRASLVHLLAGDGRAGVRYMLWSFQPKTRKRKRLPMRAPLDEAEAMAAINKCIHDEHQRLAVNLQQPNSIAHVRAALWLAEERTYQYLIAQNIAGIPLASASLLAQVEAQVAAPSKGWRMIMQFNGWKSEKVNVKRWAQAFRNRWNVAWRHLPMGNQLSTADTRSNATALACFLRGPIARAPDHTTFLIMS